ncbi:hypothetical protein HJC22_42190, partial [Corallococcus exiguus]|nr:hypothetical protein [Corallococcus exiguus]
MKTGFSTPALTVLLWLGGGVAHAQQTPAPPPTEAARPPEAPVPPPPSGAQQAHVRSSHTVDVIAPGEQVDTILGRRNAERPPP